MLALRGVSVVIALFVVLVCGQALAAEEQGFSATDKPVAVTLVRKVSTSPIGRCLTTKTSFNVRLQSIKSKTASFSRVLMNTNTTETYASKLGNGTSTDVGGCAEMADKGGFAGFSFIDGLCKMFSPGRQPCRCEAGTGDLIYVRESFWDKQDRLMPKLVPVGGELMEYVNFPSTVFDQNNDPDFPFFLIFNSRNVETDAELMLSLSRNPGLLISLSSGNERYETTVVDTAHCSMGCNRSSNFIVRRMVTHKQQDFNEFAPQRFFLSECGRTVVLNGNLSFDKRPADLLMSHKGYGCQWYTKEAEDHECTVTIPLTSKVVLKLLAVRLDGGPYTCDGDSLAIYNGTAGSDTLLSNFTSCETTILPVSLVLVTDKIVLVFTRSSKQYKPDGFNFGFLLLFGSTV